MATYPGRNAIVYLSTSIGGAPSNVLHINKWTMNRNTDKIEVTSFGDANKTYVQGLPDVKGSFSGFWDDTESKPFTGAASTSGVNIYLYPSSNAITKYWYGPAWLDMSMDCPVSGAVSISGNFAALGSWGNTF
jgi:hypothetical protein